MEMFITTSTVPLERPLLLPPRSLLRETLIATVTAAMYVCAPPHRDGVLTLPVDAGGGVRVREHESKREVCCVEQVHRVNTFYLLYSQCTPA